MSVWQRAFAITLTRTSPAWGTPTVMVSSSRGCFAALATMALHVIGFPTVLMVDVGDVESVMVRLGCRFHNSQKCGSFFMTESIESVTGVLARRRSTQNQAKRKKKKNHIHSTLFNTTQSE